MSEPTLYFLKAALDLGRPRFKVCGMSRSGLSRARIDLLNSGPIGDAVTPRRGQGSIQRVEDVDAMKVIVPAKLFEPRFNISIKVCKVADDKNQTAVPTGSLGGLEHVGKLIVGVIVGCFTQTLIKRKAVVDES